MKLNICIYIVQFNIEKSTLKTILNIMAQRSNLILNIIIILILHVFEFKQGSDISELIAI